MRVLICDDHRVFADSLALVLAEAGHTVVGVTYSPSSALRLLRDEQVDICLIDLCFPEESALDRMAELRAASAARFVILSGFVGPDVLDAALAAGVRGFAHKGQQAREIMTVLHRVHAGETITCPVIGKRTRQSRSRTEAQRLARFLTPREREVLTRLVRGESTATLAKSMGVTRSTARSHVQSVLTKLGVHSQREAVITAARYGLVSVRTGEWLLS